MSQCLLCGSPTKEFINNIKDWEYGINWESNLVVCNSCGLVSHDPEITASDIPRLYPANYLAHTPTINTQGIYGRIKRWLANSTAIKIAKNIPENGVFLEIGCGNGHLMKVISALRPDIKFIGVDIEKVPINDLANFKFYHGQFEEIEIEAASADVIYCSNLIEHVPIPTVFASKISHVLKPGGLLLGVTPDHLSLDRFLFKKYWAGYHYPRHTFIFNHKNIVTLLDHADLKQISVTGSYSFWYLSLANRFINLPGTKKRGIAFALTSALFLPIDLAINLFRCHGSMTFSARAPLNK